ncbi:MAG: hypothetical protein V4629_03190 [Pseudomonadota bacterium]
MSEIKYKFREIESFYEIQESIKFYEFGDFYYFHFHNFEGKETKISIAIIAWYDTYSEVRVAIEDLRNHEITKNFNQDFFELTR